MRTTEPHGDPTVGGAPSASTAGRRQQRERSPASARPRGRELRERFPKPVLGFLAASIITGAVGADALPHLAIVNDLRTPFLILALVSIGLRFRVAPLREAGRRPVGVYASATVVDLAVGPGLAVPRFSGFSTA